jgi:alpha-beta hydrolase superfamily lysophospholipase
MNRHDNAGAAALHEEDATVNVAGVEIACRLTLPGGTPEGVVLLLPGSLYSDVDGNYPSMNLRPHAYADLAKQLGERGFAVLRMAKIGPGTGSRTVDAIQAAAHAEFSTRVAVASAGLALLRRTVAQRPVIVAGHSEGAVVASLLAAGADAKSIDGVVSLSGPALPLLDILREQVLAMASPSTDMTMFDLTITAIRAGAAPPAEATNNPQTALFATMPAPALAYLRSVDRIDPVHALASVPHPVLIIQGGRDASVPSSHAEMLKTGRPAALTETALFPTLTHFYKVAPPDLHPMMSMGLESESDPAVADALVEWAHRLAFD